MVAVASSELIKFHKQTRAENVTLKNECDYKKISAKILWKIPNDIFQVKSSKAFILIVQFD